MQTRIISAVIRNRFTTVLLAVIAVFLLTGFQADLSCTHEDLVACEQQYGCDIPFFGAYPTVSVTVTEFDGKTPIAGATVALPGDPPVTQTTPDSGQISYPYITSGTYKVNASKDGYLAGSGSVVVPDPPGSGTYSVSIPLVRLGGTIKGTVKDAKTGAVIPRASIAMIGPAPVPALSAVADAAGTYVFDNAPVSAPLTLRASAPLYDLKELPPVTLGVGESRSAVDFALNPTAVTPPPSATVLVTLLDATTANKVPLTSVGSITIGGKPLSVNTTTGVWTTNTATPGDNQTLSITANGYTQVNRTVSLVAGQTVDVTQPESGLFPANAVAPLCESAAKSYRITLDWQRNAAAQPLDLDLLLVVPPGTGNTASCFLDNDVRGNLCSAPNAQLRIENTHVSPSPAFETVDIAQLNPGTYQVVVHDYSGEADKAYNSTMLADPKARVTVTIYPPNGPPVYATAPVPIPGTPNYWYWVPFTIDGATGKITLANLTYAFTPPANQPTLLFGAFPYKECSPF